MESVWQTAAECMHVWVDRDDAFGHEGEVFGM